MQKYLADDRFQLALQVGLGMSMAFNGGEEKGAGASSSSRADEAQQAQQQQQAEPSSSGGAGGAQPMQVGGAFGFWGRAGSRSCARWCTSFSANSQAQEAGPLPEEAA